MCILPPMAPGIPSVRLTWWEVGCTSNLKFQKIWQYSYADYCDSGSFQSDIQKKNSRAIINCKSGRLGINISQCPDCQAVNKEIWVDKRRAEVIDTPYFHVVFTLPHELNPLVCCNQQLLYALLHKCCAQTLLELSSNEKWLGVIALHRVRPRRFLKCCG